MKNKSKVSICVRMCLAFASGASKNLIAITTNVTTQTIEGSSINERLVELCLLVTDGHLICNKCSK